MGEGTIPPTASLRARERGVVIMTKKAIKLIAKQLRYPII